MRGFGKGAILKRFVIEDFWDAVGEIWGKREGVNEGVIDNSKFQTETI